MKTNIIEICIAMACQTRRAVVHIERCYRPIGGGCCCGPKIFPNEVKCKDRKDSHQHEPSRNLAKGGTCKINAFININTKALVHCCA